MKRRSDSQIIHLHFSFAFLLFCCTTMCRLLLYKGKQPILLAHVGYCYSINTQGFPLTTFSFSPTLPIPLSTKLLTLDCDSIIDDRSMVCSTLYFIPLLKLNDVYIVLGDGFGVGWYDSEPDEGSATPCIFTSVTPAWSNSNLVRLAERIKSPLLFAHVRASTSGAVTEANCHPWK